LPYEFLHLTAEAEAFVKRLRYIITLLTRVTQDFFCFRTYFSAPDAQDKNSKTLYKLSLFLSAEKMKTHSKESIEKRKKQAYSLLWNLRQIMPIYVGR